MANDQSMVQGSQSSVEPREQGAASVQAQDLPRAVPPVDIYENQDEFLLIADVPGVQHEDVDVRLEEGRLALVAPQRLGSDDEHPLCFQRTFTVPDTVDPDGVRAELHDGVLTLHLAKGEHARPRRIQVNAG